MKRLNLLLFIPMLCFFTDIRAQFEITGEIRIRPEIRYGFKQLPDSGTSPACFISQRTRLAMAHKYEKLSFFISIQDVRIWGDEQMYSSTGVQGDNSSLDLKEGWFQYDFTGHFSVKAGRQEFKYADQRLLAARNWNQYGMSYDALLLSYKGNWQLDAGLSYNNNGELVFQDFYDMDRFRSLNFLYLKKELATYMDLEGLYILSGVQKPTIKEELYLRNTYGILVTIAPDKYKINTSGYYQNGLNSQGKNVQAWMINASAERTSEKLRLGVGTDIISGDKTNNNDPAYQRNDHGFDLLYGARHRYYGEMDYFSNYSGIARQGGMMDLYTYVGLKAYSDLTVSASYHYFNLLYRAADPTDIELPIATLDPHLADELDIKFSYSSKKHIQLEMGYSVLQGTPTLKSLKQNDNSRPETAHWVWMMITIKPVLFKSN